MTDLLSMLEAANPEHETKPTPPPELRRALLERVAATSPPSSRRNARRRLLPVAAIAALVVCGGAAAAVLSLTGTPSEPSGGLIVGAAPGQPDRYRIAMTADLTLGATGWCTSVTTSVASERATLGTHCTPAPKPGALLLDGGVTLLSSDQALVFYLVGPTVAGARLHDNQVVRAAADPALPPNVRLIAAIVPAQGYKFDEGYLRTRLLDVTGQPLTATASDLQDLATTRPAASPDASIVRHAACATTGGAGVTLRRTGSLTSQALRKTTGAALVTCATATVRLDGVSLRVAVLARQSKGAKHGSELAPPVAGDVPGARQSARRLPGGWLVVEGGTTAQRRSALERMTASIAP